MRKTTTHHDGHGLNESIKIEADQPGPGGASHVYKASVDTGGGYMLPVAHVVFQKGPRNVEGSTPGVTDIALLAIVEDRLKAFQSGAFACDENQEALEAIRGAMEHMKERANKRAARGVLGTYNK